MEESIKKTRNIKKQELIFSIVAVLLIMIFATAIVPIELQNDTFYTIKLGEYVVGNGITMKDPFSWHEGLTYTFPHWAYDVMIYLFYSVGNMEGVYLSTIILSIILALTIYSTNVKLNKNKVTSFIIAIATMYLLKPYIAARAQLLTFILLLLTVYFIEKFLETKKIKYAIFLVIIPIIIANFHAAIFWFYFVLYLPYIGEYAIYILEQSKVIINQSKINAFHKKIKKIKDEKEINRISEQILKLEENTQLVSEKIQKNNESSYKVKLNYNPNIRALIFIMIICLFTGLLTPQTTFEPYTHIIKLMQGNTTQNISEHNPLVLVNNIKLTSLFIVYLAILMFTRTKIRLADLFMLGGLTVLTFYTRRQESMLLLMGSIILNRLICTLLSEYNSNYNKESIKYATSTVGIITITAIVLGLSIFTYKERKQDKQYISEKSYPVQASDWIIENLDYRNIKLYNEYNYGSYLLYRGIPVFIDSRADLYSPQFNEGSDIFTDYLNISGISKSNEAKFDKYGFTHFITYSGSKLREYFDVKEDQYIKLYDDEKFCIYERINGN